MKEYYNWSTQTNTKAKIETTFKTIQVKYSGWFNITNEGAGHISSIKMDLCRWRYADVYDVHNLALSSDSIAIDVVDLTPCLTPSTPRMAAPPTHCLTPATRRQGEIEEPPEEPPPALPRRHRGAQYVIICSPETCKPSKK